MQLLTDTRRAIRRHRTVLLAAALLALATAFGAPLSHGAAPPRTAVGTIEIEGRPLAEFLHWASLKTGRKLVLADEIARHQVLTIHMHGSIRGLSVMEALNAVMDATSLSFDMPDGELRIRSAHPTTTTMPVSGT